MCRQSQRGYHHGDIYSQSVSSFCIDFLICQTTGYLKDRTDVPEKMVNRFRTKKASKGLSTRI
jgi:hypothetical protein